MSVVPLADAKPFLNITSNTQDDELGRMIERAEAVLAARVGPLAPTPVTDEIHTGPGPLLLKQWPVISVSSATSDGATVTDLVLDAPTGLLYGSFGATRFGVKVSYTTGRPSLPPDLEEAVLELVAHLWQSQRGTSPSQLALQQPNEDLQVGRSFLLPYRVQSLIEPHLLPPVIA